MKSATSQEKMRQRAPSRRSLETRARILDAAELLFAERGFDGASIRDIAAVAQTQAGLVHHHGEGKEELFRQVVARRADELSALRLAALDACRARGQTDLAALLRCFVGPYVERAESGGPQWLAYARLIAHVSADPRWRAISSRHFDATATIFIDEIAALYPDASREKIATGFVYSVAAMLALLTSRWRVGELSGSETPEGARGGLEDLVTFCAAGISAAIAK
ncbi:TetR/AcrR family transcriptional regulator [Pseudohoeflea suaedae]|uniref:TetR/AcrR family transcriptional regulator n=1 Tax=Pseudohoeflea suaedae TaxID=877384 RepID=A0A4R5PQT6_9HYPH|nr:TetR/AcrR family transcriptional regulator [Pseudohoeflea suaedae]TDH39273.1 TetR/AcrR family transcriptional regulator [Pseudohoeflea suaedae]